MCDESLKRACSVSVYVMLGIRYASLLTLAGTRVTREDV